MPKCSGEWHDQVFAVAGLGIVSGEEIDLQFEVKALRLGGHWGADIVPAPDADGVNLAGVNLDQSAGELDPEVWGGQVVRLDEQGLVAGMSNFIRDPPDNRAALHSCRGGCQRRILKDQPSRILSLFRNVSSLAFRGAVGNNGSFKPAFEEGIGAAESEGSSSQGEGKNQKFHRERVKMGIRRRTALPLDAFLHRPELACSVKIATDLMRFYSPRSLRCVSKWRKGWKVMHEPLEQDAARYNLGLHEPHETFGIEEWLDMEPELARVVAEMKELQAVALLREARRLNRRPAAGLRERVLAGIQAHSQQRFPKPVVIALQEAKIPEPKLGQPVVFAGHDRIVRWVNSAFTMLCGYSATELLGYKAGSKLRGERSEPEAADVLHRAVHERIPVVQKIVNYHKNGTAYLVEITLHPVSAGFVAIENSLGNV